MQCHHIRFQPGKVTRQALLRNDVVVPQRARQLGQQLLHVAGELLLGDEVLHIGFLEEASDGVVCEGMRNGTAENEPASA